LKENIDEKSDLLCLETKKLKKILEKEFPDNIIINFGMLTEKISVITKVREGKSLSFNDYDEVSLTLLDKYGVLLPSKRGEDLKLANKKSIDSQSLNHNDILISYRSRKHYSVGRVGDNYKRTIVGNNSAIRIQFNRNIQASIPIMVQAYLSLDYVQDFLRAASYNKEHTRPLLSPKVLMELPIPEFTLYSQPQFEEVYKYRYDFLDGLESIQKSSSTLSDTIKKKIPNDLKLFNETSLNFTAMIEKKKRVDALLTLLEGNLEELVLLTR